MQYLTQLDESMRTLNFILLIFISSCSAQWHLKKAIKKDPTLVQVDTLRVTDIDTFITETVQHDTSFFMSRDTTIIVKDRMTIKHYIHDSTVYIEGECLGDTIIKTEVIEMPVEKVVYNESWFPKWFLIIIAGLVVYAILRRFLNL